MNLIQPSLLPFLVLAAIPVVLYILFRLRKTQVGWGASYILKQTLKQKRRQNIWKQIAVITLRTLMLAALVLAFARPLRSLRHNAADASYPHGQQRLHRVLLIDNSKSMLALSGSVSRLDAARITAGNIVAGMRVGDTCDVVALAPSPNAAKDTAAQTLSIRIPSTATETSHELAAITPSQSPVDFASAMRVAIERFREVAAPERQLIILTDLCRIDHPHPEDLGVFGEQFAKLNTRVAVLSLNPRETPNLAIASLTPGVEDVLAGQATNFYADVFNFGDSASPETPLRFMVDGEMKSEQVIALPPGGHRTIALPASFTSGRHKVEIRVGADAFPNDDSASALVNARAGVNVLLVTPADEKAQGFEREGEFIRRAFTAAADTPFKLQLNEIASNQFFEQSLNEPDVVILAGVPSVDPATAKALAKFVGRGGGLIVSVGSATEAAAINAALAPLLPVTLGEPIRTGELDYERYLTIQTADLDTPLLREFEQPYNGDLAAARVYNHFRVTPPSDAAVTAASRTLVSYATGAPMLIERKVGRGRVMLMTTTLGAGWNSMPVHQAYQPFLLRLVNELVGNIAVPRNIAQGKPMIADLPPGDGELFITTPDAKLEPVKPVTIGTKRFVRYEAARSPGVYELQDSAGKVLASFVVSGDTRESDLRALEPVNVAKLEHAVAGKVTYDEAGLRSALWREGDGAEVSGFFLVAVALMLALDAFLTWVWFR